jgi:hypothetical protein
VSTAGYRNRGVQALVELHAQHLSAFVETWREASAAGVTLPPSDDPNCADLAALLHHVLRAARGYMTWICECLDLPDPGIDPVPEGIAGDPGPYLEHLLERWDGPLLELEGATAERAVYPSRWGVLYCIDAMLEHAVMHPIRHRSQLQRAATAS